MAWQFVLANRSTGAAIGEVTDASDRSINFGLSTMNSASFKINVEHPLASSLLDDEPLVLIYSKPSGATTGTLMMVCEIVTVEEAVKDGSATIAVTLAEAGYFRLQRRLIGRTNATAAFSSGTVAVPVSRATAAAAVIDEVNAAFFGWGSGVTKGTMTAGGTTVAGPWYFKPAMEALIDLAFASDGFDFVFDPVLPTAGIVASFRCALNIGSAKPEAIFEYGTGQRNVIEYKRQVTRDSLVTDAYVLPDGYPDNTAGAVSYVGSSTGHFERGSWEAAIPSDLTSALSRDSLANQHVALRFRPRQRIEFVPGANAPVYGVDYSVGDTVTARAEHPSNAIRFNAAFRVYGAAVSLSDEGLERVALTLLSD